MPVISFPLRAKIGVLTYFGLKSLNQTKRIGLRALIKESSKNPPLEIGDLVFGIGPMINAVGRLSDAKHAVTLLLATDEAFAYENARLLAEKNQERKIVDRSILAEAKQLFSEKRTVRIQKINCLTSGTLAQGRHRYCGFPNGRVLL